MSQQDRRDVGGELVDHADGQRLSHGGGPAGDEQACGESDGHVEELELDGVGIPEDDNRVGHRVVGVDDA